MSRNRKSKQNYFVQAALKEVSLLRKHLNVVGQGDSVHVEGEVSPNAIKDFYREYFASVRQPNLGDEKVLPDIDRSKLRALYVGQPDVNLLLNLVVRHCLYADQIVVVDPFITLPHDDVLKRPQVWVQTIINRALCLCGLEDWIEQDLILVIPSIFHYHPELQQFTLENPYVLSPHLSDKEKHEIERHLIVRLLVSEPPETRAAFLDLIASMGRSFAEGEQNDLLGEAEQYEARFPTRFRLSSSYFQKHFKGEMPSQVVDFTLSMPLLLAPTIAEQIGAFLIFEHQLSYDLLRTNQSPMNTRSDSLQQLAIAFQELDFPFLHNVSLRQALDLRTKGYLNSFRVYLREIWSAVAAVEENESLDARIFEFSDRLKSEYVELEKEWNSIRRELRVKALTSGLVVGLSAGSAIAFGNIDWTVGAITGAGVGLLKELMSGYMGSSENLQRAYRNPLSVFLMLKD